MKTVTITNKDFVELIYPSVAGDAPDTVAKMKLVVGILTKLEDVSAEVTAKAVDGKGEEVTVTYREYEEDVKHVDFEFEDAEAEYLHERMVSQLSKIPVSRSRHLIPILTALKE